MSHSRVSFSFCSADARLGEDDSQPSGNLVSQNGNPSHLAVDSSLWWPQGKKLTVKFLNGTNKLHDRVKFYAQTWEMFANIDFRFIKEGDADIRVGFQWHNDHGTWSEVGQNARKFRLGQNTATVNFGELHDNSEEDDFCRVITHEFGHVIGCVHEHQANPIQWDEQKVIADCKRDYKWSEATTRTQIIDKERNIKTLRKSTFDSSSIMCYYYPPEWTVDGTSAPKNKGLSVTDKSFISKVYPFQTRNEGQLSIDPDIRSWYPPAPLNSKAIQFSPPYTAPPRMTLGLKKLDLGNAANIRIRTAADKVSEGEFILNVDSWGDTQLFNATPTWIEFSPADSDYETGELNTLYNRSVGTLAVPGDDGVRRDIESFAFSDDKYTEPPNIIVWLNALDLDKERNWRVRASAVNVTSSGFDLAIESWGDTLLYSATASWAAYPKRHEGVASGRVSTREIREWFPPIAENFKKIKFPPKSFDRAPKVFVAINELDMNCSGNLRVAVSAEKVDASGFVWHGSSWGDSQLYTVGADWIAFG
ncbi:hypothetical protein D7B24_006491 [Verticillium nonalfalfae]|uniref:Peptidase metallopeptidase domain-containing protein n=1 Tax=Verticillium nonalfalfae TaxID=1051616 RepID=A0A3M9Y917_9PEZI|nr:uncharacterized protein D7B24_006491 [Verticillium nonalfalfae]RNJ56969.1 hypothetical protein D7B24_006491 [Verticillium nonalfalfae]